MQTVPYPPYPVTDDVKAVARAAKGMVALWGGTFEDMVRYVLTVLQHGPILPTVGTVGDTVNGVVQVFPSGEEGSDQELAAVSKIMFWEISPGDGPGGCPSPRTPMCTNCSPLDSTSHSA